MQILIKQAGASMIEFIDGRLKCWAEWASRRDDCGLGYVQSQLARLGQAGGGGKFAGVPHGVCEDDLHELQLIVAYLPFELHQAVWQCYMTRGTAVEHAEACGCSKRTYYNRLDTAHLLVMEALQVGIDEVPLLVVGRAAMVAPLMAGNAVARNNFKKVLTI